MPLSIQGETAVPGDKSLSHRSLMFAAAAKGESRIRGILTGADCRSTAEVLRALGCDIPELDAGTELRIQSGGLAAWHAPAQPLDCGNSGTTVRLLMGLLAGRPFCATLTGDASLSNRPMRRITEPLLQMGADFDDYAHSDRLPITICGGPLRGIEYRSPKASAQIKSAVLLAGLSAGVPVAVLEPEKSRDHTEILLDHLGLTVGGEAREDGWFVTLDPNHDLQPIDIDVPGDPSSAAFLAALASLADSGEIRIEGVGLNPTRTGFFDALERMGGKLRYENRRATVGEPVGDLVVEAARLRGIQVGGAEIPAMIDELPLIACLGARAEGETVITGAEELRAKESDRISVVVRNLREIGVEAEERADGMVIRGSDAPLRGKIRVHHDHRIAMAFGVLSRLPNCDIEIDVPDVVDVSFPGYWHTLDGLIEGATA